MKKRHNIIILYRCNVYVLCMTTIRHRSRTSGVVACYSSIAVRFGDVTPIRRIRAQYCYQIGGLFFIFCSSFVFHFYNIIITNNGFCRASFSNALLYIHALPLYVVAVHRDIRRQGYTPV